jgi:hypothetical protein
MSDVRFLYPVAYDAGYQLGRFDTKPTIRFGAFINSDPDASSRHAEYTAFCEGEGDGTRDRWAAGGATERERALLERVHAAQRARGIVPLPMPPRG